MATLPVEQNNNNDDSHDIQLESLVANNNVAKGRRGKPDRESTGKTIVDKWSDITTIQGVSQIKSAKQIVRKLFWLLLMLSAFAYLVYQIVSVTRKYYRYPTSTQQFSKQGMPIPFPAITLCNLSPVRMTKFKSLRGNNTKLMTALFSPMELIAVTDKSSLPRITRDRYLFQDDYNALDANIKISAGTSLKNFLIKCSYANQFCNKSQFTSFLHPMYGNCYTFNSKLTQSLQLLTERPGPDFGFSAEFFIDQAEYVGALAESAGIRVVIHESHRMPFPDEEGYNIEPGRETHMSVRAKRIMRLPAPYEQNCKHFTSSGNRKINMYSVRSKYSLQSEYSTEACSRTCLQLAIEDECGCSINAYAPTTPWRNDTGVKFCKFGDQQEWRSGSSQIRCATDVRTRMGESCRDACNPSCSSMQYSVQISQAKWPSKNALERVLYDVTSGSNDFFRKKTANVTNMPKFAESNLVKLIVYYGGSYIDVQRTEPSYEIVDLLSDIGGNAGLFLGMTVLTLVEILQLIFDLTMMVLFDK